jgi:SAM-dependent methyltransferase
MNPIPAKVSTTQRYNCSACGHANLEEVIALPSLPLTGIFVRPDERGNYPSFDQALMCCAMCGHGQLRETVDPEYLYRDTYTHRSSLSPISTRGNDFFLNFVEDVTAGRPFQCIIEIGCNDLYLLRKLLKRAENLIGFDPIWKDQPLGDNDGISVTGKYIEEINPESDLPQRPDLVLSVHTLEHVNDPLNSLRSIFDYAQPGALFIFEVPSLDTLLMIGRFDQIFHQHLNYFSLASIHRMIRELGGEFISSRYNYGYWLGTMMVAFQKPVTIGRPDTGEASELPPIKREQIKSRYTDYQHSVGATYRTLEHLIKQGMPAVGFGAAQMVPTLAYHMRSDFGELQAIVDDNPDKAGQTYPSIATTIRPASEFPTLENHAVLITAVDSTRPLIDRLSQLQPRYIVNSNVPF